MDILDNGNRLRKGKSVERNGYGTLWGLVNHVTGKIEVNSSVVEV